MAKVIIMKTTIDYLISSQQPQKLNELVGEGDLKKNSLENGVEYFTTL